MKKTTQENIEEVKNYLDKVSKHVYFDGTRYLIVNKINNKYYVWRGESFEEESGYTTEVNINRNVSWFAENAKNYTSHELFLIDHIDTKYHSVRQNKLIREFRKFEEKITAA